MKIHKAAEILFYENPEIRDLFALPKKVRYSPKEVEEETPEEVAA